MGRQLSWECTCFAISGTALLLYISHVPRTAWSRWTVLLRALIASLTSPALAVAHGVAHAHGAEEHRGHTGHAMLAHEQAPEHEVVTAHEHAHEQAHEHANERAPEHEPARDHEHDPPLAHDEDDASLGEQTHGHRHDHARAEPGTTGKPDVRTMFETSVVVDAAPQVLPLETHAQSPVSRLDIVALARPAPDTGPPPALRAPPVR